MDDRLESTSRFSVNSAKSARGNCLCSRGGWENFIDLGGSVTSDVVRTRVKVAERSIVDAVHFIVYNILYFIFFSRREIRHHRRNVYFYLCWDMFDIQGSFATGRNESVEENLETRSFIFVHTGNGKPIKEINRFVSKKLFLTNRFWLMNDINFDREMSKTITIEICVKLLKFVDINIYVNYLQKKGA